MFNESIDYTGERLGPWSIYVTNIWKNIFMSVYIQVASIFAMQSQRNEYLMMRLDYP